MNGARTRPGRRARPCCGTAGCTAWNPLRSRPTTALLICDSQCTGDSWIDQGARGAGFDQIVKRGFPGAGYLAPSSAAGTGVADGVVRNAILLPDGAPGVIIVTLGGNDAARSEPAAAVTAAMDQLVAVLRQAYPDAPIVIDGVMSRRDAAHAGRRAMDAVIVAEAERLGCLAISVAGWVSDYSAPQLDNVHLTPRGTPGSARTTRRAEGRPRALSSVLLHSRSSSTGARPRGLRTGCVTGPTRAAGRLASACE